MIEHDRGGQQNSVDRLLSLKLPTAHFVKDQIGPRVSVRVRRKKGLVRDRPQGLHSTFDECRHSQILGACSDAPFRYVEQAQASGQHSRKDGEGDHCFDQRTPLISAQELLPAAVHRARTMPVRLTTTIRRSPLRPSRVTVVGVALVPRGLKDTEVPALE